MGNPKLKWTTEEEDALLAGISKYGPGRWKNIISDPDFASVLINRTNIDLKDKWRNLCANANSGVVPRDKSKLLKVEGPKLTSPLSISKNLTPAGGVADAVKDDAVNAALGKIVASRYDTMIFEALSTAKDAKGCEFSAIVRFFEQRPEVPKTFEKMLRSRLRRLVSRGKVEKVQGCYRLLNDTLGTKTPTPKQKDVRPRQSHIPSRTCNETVDEAGGANAAYWVAEAENKSLCAAEAVEEAERVAKLSEDADAMLQLVKEIYIKCLQGERFLLL